MTKRTFKNPQRQLFESDHDDLKWWEVFPMLFMVLTAYTIVIIVEWFRNPIKRGFFVSFIISIALTWIVVYATCRIIYG